MGPPVVFISQIGVGGASWAPIIERLDTAVVCFAYDRPGCGDAPPRPAPNPPLPYSVFACELADALTAAGLHNPVVLVGHSVGSLIARAFAAGFPERVAGMVHVDGSIPRLALITGEDVSADGDGPDATGFDLITGEVEILEAAVPPVPTVVISRRSGWWIGPPPHPRVDDLWQVHQRLLARETGAPQIVAVNAGHQVPGEAPALVAYVIDRTVAAARDGAPVAIDPDTVTTLDGRLVPASGS